MIKLFNRTKKPQQRSKPSKIGKRYYMAALKDNLTAGWGTAILSADSSINGDLTKLRARSRLLTANDPYYKYWLKLQNRNVVGSKGIRLQMKVVDRFNNDGSKLMDDAANRIIEEAWQDWGKRQNCLV